MKTIAVDQAAVRAKQKYTGVGQHAADGNDIVEVRTGHLDVSTRNTVVSPI